MLVHNSEIEGKGGRILRGQWILTVVSEALNLGDSEPAALDLQGFEHMS